jgi:hypothetical protein
MQQDAKYANEVKNITETARLKHQHSYRMAFNLDGQPCSGDVGCSNHVINCVIYAIFSGKPI